MSPVLEHAYLVTVDADRRVIPDGWLLVDGERIAAIGAHYLVTVLALAGFLRTMRAPAALGTAYVRA